MLVGMAMSEFTIKCPHCQKELEATEDMAGQTAECPNCGKALVIPAQPKPKLQLRKSAPSLPRSSPPPAPPSYSAPNPAPLREPPRKQMSFTCPHCETGVQGRCYAGETVRCPTCDGAVIVPEPSTRTDSSNTWGGILLVIVLLVIGGGIWAWLSSPAKPKTRDDYEQLAYDKAKKMVYLSLVDRSYYDVDSWSVVENKHPWYILRLSWRAHNAFGGVAIQSGLCCLKLTEDGNNAEYGQNCGVQTIGDKSPTELELAVVKKLNNWHSKTGGD